jgi:penicillin-binding protein 1A
MSETPRYWRPEPEAPEPRGLERFWLLGVVVMSLTLLAGAAGWMAFQAVFLSDIPEIPSAEALWTVRRSPGIEFLDANGGLIAARGAKYGERVSLSGLPPFVPQAFLAAEDRRYYSHGPIDPYAIMRALGRDFIAGRPAEGASTLSQQLARTLFLSQAHSFKRKVQEAVLAGRLESLLGKNALLELYLNRVFLGSGAYGLDAAAQTYFAKPAGRLTLGEAALLAAMPNAPTRLSPVTNMAGAWARARRILEIMRGEGWVSLDDERAALAAPPDLAPPHGGEGNWSYILDQASVEAGGLSGDSHDLVVRLTIDPRLQALGLAAVRDVVSRAGKSLDVSQGALVALAPDGAIRAMVGGLDHKASAFNRVTQAKRQPGSSFKAFVFGAAVEAGLKPTDTRKDAPVALGAWAPHNYGGHYAGEVSVQQALARSLNTVAVRLALEVGPGQVAAFARRCGLMDIPANPGPSIALGAYEVTLLELASGYQVFQNGGARSTPYLIDSVATTNGEVLFSHAATSPGRVTDPLFATRMLTMLKTVITAGTGTGANIGRPAAGKTGTSQNWRDAWFIGFTPDLLAGVWVGNDDNRPMNKVTGGSLPAAIWRQFMTGAEAKVAPADFPWVVPEPDDSDQETIAAGNWEDQPDSGGSVPLGPTADPDSAPDEAPAPDHGRKRHRNTAADSDSGPPAVRVDEPPPM